jgi:hypothetical protein
MERAINPDITEGPGSPFKAFAPMGTASARIKIGAALYWLSPTTYKNLELIRKIRNEFAHRPFRTSFDTDPVASYLDATEPVEERPWKAEAERMIPYEGAPRRLLFHIRTCLTCAYMLGELGSAPYATRMGLPPMAAFADGGENWPEPFHAALVSALELMLILGNPSPSPTTTG